MDAELIEQLEKARQGDVQAFSYVATAFRTQLIAWAHELTRDAEDAAQEALITAYTHLGDLRELEALPGWLRTLTRTAALRQGRRKRPDAIAEPEATAAHEDPVGDAEVRQAVRGAVRELSEAQQQVIEQYYLEGRKIGEIARAMSLPEGTVKRRLHDAREKLRVRLAGFGPGRNDDEWKG
ncbi:MAG: sigma-70 family RNA polymerase sigma factor [Planctomycetes bacterium]|nr:sigma-70 family RNA polymerase sigma factor [Planctomycetota bacterium]